MSIKLFIETTKFKGGPATFRSRIIPILAKIEGIKIITDVNKKFDIELAFIRKIYKHSKPYVLRVDGCYYEKGRESGNKGMRKSILKANYSIFQSNFSFDLCDHILEIKNFLKGEKKDYSIIYNGIDFDYIKKIRPNKKIPSGSFVACAQWRPNKRPVSMIKGFLESGIKRHLYIIGGSGLGGKKINKKYKSKYIHILGEKNNKEIIAIMKACEYQIHLCHIDSCPNTVIEGLACGLNVLCTNLGGTKEIVKNNGIILKVDKFWNGKYLRKMNLDNLKSTVVAKGIYNLLKIKNRVDRPDLNIKNTVIQYSNIIKKILEN